VTSLYCSNCLVVVDVIFLIFKYLHKSFKIEFVYSDPMSKMNVFIGPYLNIKDSKIAFATVLVLLLAIEMTIKYFVKSHISVTAYSLLLSDFGSGPIVSTIPLSKAFIRMSVIVTGVFLCVFTFDFWHF